jgi:hypothetical protein
LCRSSCVAGHTGENCCTGTLLPRRRDFRPSNCRLKTDTSASCEHTVTASRCCPRLALRPLPAARLCVAKHRLLRDHGVMGTVWRGSPRMSPRRVNTVMGLMRCWSELLSASHSPPFRSSDSTLCGPSTCLAPASATPPLHCTGRLLLWKEDTCESVYTNSSRGDCEVRCLMGCDAVWFGIY